MVPTVPGPVLVVLAIIAAAVVALVTWGVLRWVLNAPAEQDQPPVIPVCPECGTPLSAGMCPRCVKKTA